MENRPLTRASVRASSRSARMEEQWKSSCSVVLNRASVQNCYGRSKSGTSTAISKSTAKTQSRKCITTNTAAVRAVQNHQPTTSASPTRTSPRARKTFMVPLFENVASQRAARTAKNEQVNGQVESLREKFESNMNSFTGECNRINDQYARELAALHNEYSAKLIELKHERDHDIANAQARALNFSQR